MPSAWIDHVKNYQQQHGCSYKDAMTQAKSSYKCKCPSSSSSAKSGGSVKTVVRKVKNTIKKGKKGVKQVTKEIEKNQKFINLIAGDEMGAKVAKANDYAKEVNESIGGKIKTKNVVRKVKNTAKKIKNIAKKVEPLVMLADPELGLALHTGIEATGGSYASVIKTHRQKLAKKAGGSFAVPKAGGSFTVPKAGSGYSKALSGGSGGPKPKNPKHEYSNQFSLLPAGHPSNHPVKPKLK